MGTIVNAAMTALNVAWYAASPNPWNLGAAVFCGILTVFCLVMEAA